MEVVKVYFFDNETAHFKMLELIESFFNVEFVEKDEKFSVAINKKESFLLNYNKFNLNFIVDSSNFYEKNLIHNIQQFLQQSSLDIKGFHIEDSDKKIVLN